MALLSRWAGCYLGWGRIVSNTRFVFRRCPGVFPRTVVGLSFFMFGLPLSTFLAPLFPSLPARVWGLAYYLERARASPSCAIHLIKRVPFDRARASSSCAIHLMRCLSCPPTSSPSNCGFRAQNHVGSMPRLLNLRGRLPCGRLAVSRVGPGRKKKLTVRHRA